MEYDNISEEQIEICKKEKVTPMLPANDQLVVVSEGVLEGNPVEGVRYPSPEHMSGWWLTTDKYDGNIKTLRNEHILHLAEKRPELMKYIALPSGFRFFQSGYKGGAEKIWFDEKVAKEKP